MFHAACMTAATATRPIVSGNTDGVDITKAGQYH